MMSCWNCSDSGKWTEKVLTRAKKVSNLFIDSCINNEEPSKGTARAQEV